ncbi:MAG: MBL fold metallo-hydrolase [Planctomycetota bacterium]|nr:MBL fold metallo-hydrolase [Planctomycetota bacterium]
MAHESGQHGRHEPQPRPHAARQIADVARSSLRRYPGHFAEALRERVASGAASSDGVSALGVDALHDLKSRSLAAAWLGHASVLLRVGGLWVLTDPVFSRRIGVRVGGVTFGPQRQWPAPDPAALPRPDVILLSHAHFDHLDRPSLAALAHRETVVVTARRTRRLVPRGFGAVHEVGWDESIDVLGLSLGVLRPRHWGARTLVDRLRGYNAYEITSGGSRVLFAGDSAYTEEFARVQQPTLSIFGIGAYDPWIDNHASPEEAWRMFRSTQGAYMLPIHHSTFVLSHEPSDEPMARLLAAAGEERWRIVAHKPGDVWTGGDA